MIVFFNGKFVDESEVSIPLTDAGYRMGYGIYDTMRTLDGKFMFMFEHKCRIYSDAENMHIPLQYSVDKIEGFIREIASKRWEELGRNVDLRIVTIVTADSYDFFTGKVGGANVLIQAIPVKKISYDCPVRVVTYHTARPLAHIKSTSMIGRIDPRKYALKNDAFETIMCEEVGMVVAKGEGGKVTKKPKELVVLEGTFTNVFVVQGNTILTTESGVLGGIAREEIIDITHDCMSVDIRDVTIGELMDADEVFLCNSVRGIIPVSHVDGIQVGDGKIGKWTRRIEEMFWDRVKKHRLE